MWLPIIILERIADRNVKTFQPQIIADTLFLHERGAYNTLYFTFYFAALMVGPIVAGAMALHVGWRNFWWLNVALFAAVLILLVFFFPETKWHRVHPSELARANTSPQSDISETEKPIVGHSSITQDIDDGDDTAPESFLHNGRPSKTQFRLYQQASTPLQTLLQGFWIPWKLHLYPIVEFASFVVSWTASSFLVVNLTQSQAFAAPPYNWSSQSIGFTNFATLVGALIGLATNGALSDWISMRATKKNKGIREPEMRLPAMIPYVLISVLGNFIVAFGYQNSWDWKASNVLTFLNYEI